MARPPAQVPDAVAPPPHHPRFALIDGMRAIAALSVLVSHAAVMGGVAGNGLGVRLLTHLNVGVTIFFLISGFLLFRPFIAERNGGGGPPRVPVYAWRRALRIYPAYWVVLTFLVIAPGLVGVVDGHWLAQYTLTQAFLEPTTGCTAAVLECGLAQTWSLSAEVTFYFALPVYVVASAWLATRTGRRWLAGELVVLGTLAAFSITLHATLDPSPVWIGGTAIWWLFWFVLGMGLAAISVALDGRARQPAAVRLIAARPELPWLAAIALYVALSLDVSPTAFLFGRGEQMLVHICFGLVALLLLLPAVFGADGGGAPRRFLAHPVVAWLGLVSYGIFLWHYVVALHLGLGGAELGFGFVLVGTLAISIPCAAVSYYAIERPLLRYKYRARDRS
jgi:peptidoglycan/LPS O-acetylase OafA/YrhL